MITPFLFNILITIKNGNHKNLTVTQNYYNLTKLLQFYKIITI